MATYISDDELKSAIDLVVGSGQSFDESQLKEFARLANEWGIGADRITGVMGTRMVDDPRGDQQVPFTSLLQRYGLPFEAQAKSTEQVLTDQANKVKLPDGNLLTSSFGLDRGMIPGGTLKKFIDAGGSLQWVNDENDLGGGYYQVAGVNKDQVNQFLINDRDVQRQVQDTLGRWGVNQNVDANFMQQLATQGMQHPVMQQWTANLAKADKESAAKLMKQAVMSIGIMVGGVALSGGFAAGASGIDATLGAELAAGWESAVTTSSLQNATLQNLVAGGMSYADASAAIAGASDAMLSTWATMPAADAVVAAGDAFALGQTGAATGGGAAAGTGAGAGAGTGAGTAAGTAAATKIGADTVGKAIAGTLGVIAGADNKPGDVSTTSTVDVLPGTRPYIDDLLAAGKSTYANALGNIPQLQNYNSNLNLTDYQPTLTDKYINDAIAAAIQPNIDALRERVLPSITGGNIAKGTLGSSKQAVAEAVAMRENTRANNEIAAKMRQQYDYAAADDKYRATQSHNQNQIWSADDLYRATVYNNQNKVSQWQMPQNVIGNATSSLGTLASGGKTQTQTTQLPEQNKYLSMLGGALTAVGAYDKYFGNKPA